MAVFGSDAFSGTSGDLLSTYDANWVLVSGVTGTATISDAGRLRGTNTTTAAYYRDDVTPTGADYSVLADVYVVSTVNNRPGVSGRNSTSANTSYYARWNNNLAGVELFKVVAGTATQLGSTISQTVSVGNSYRIELRMAGTSIECYWDNAGSATISATDSAISAAGFPGVRFQNSSTASNTVGQHLDNWSAEEAGAAASSLAFRPRFPMPILNF